MEVGCPGTRGLELPTPNPGSKSTPKACPTRNPATSPARQTQPQPKHPSHRARSSVEITKIITIVNNNNIKSDNNNEKQNNNKNTNSWFSHDVTKIQTTKLLVFLRFYSNDV